MSMNRRNVLVGLGTIVAGGGAALGTGAFSTVEADRQVSVSLAEDSNALLAIEAATAYSGSGDQTGEAAIDLTAPENASGLNVDALTELEGTIAFTNQGQTGDTVEITTSTPSTVSIDSTDYDLEEVDKTGDGVSNSTTIGVSLVFNDSYTVTDVDNQFDASSTASTEANNTGVATSSSSVASGEVAIYDLQIDLRGSDLGSGASNFDIPVTVTANNN